MYVNNCERDISLRAYDSTGAPRLTTIPYGDTVTYLDGAYDSFSKVSYHDMTGYALTKCLTTRRPYITQKNSGDWTGGNQPVQPNYTPENGEPHPLTDANWRDTYRRVVATQRALADGVEIEYFLHDLNQDGVPELFLGNMLCDAYTIDNGAAHQMGYVFSQGAIYADAAEEFLYAETHGGTGLRGFEKFGLDGLSFTIETIVEGYEGESQASFTKGDAREPITQEEFEAICMEIENTYPDVRIMPASEFQ
ncbi:MAG: SH3 domain-containing protein [Clostridia bacterium]